MKTKVEDITEISQNLSNRIEFDSIEFSQILIGELGESINDLLFVKKMYGLWFYTSKASLDHKMHLKHMTAPIPTYVVLDESK